jgi:RimJ/RimL family protein N-acetyltransferase
VFGALYAHVRAAAIAEGAGGLRLYADNTNARAHRVYEALGMRGDHYRVFEEMFTQAGGQSEGWTPDSRQ